MKALAHKVKMPRVAILQRLSLEQIARRDHLETEAPKRPRAARAGAMHLKGALNGRRQI